MEGRWAYLAVSAQMKGYLDFSEISKEDPKSLRKEKLIFQMLEKEFRLDYKKAKALYNLNVLLTKKKESAWANNELSAYYKLRLPWMTETQSLSPVAALPGFADFVKNFKNPVIEELKNGRINKRPIDLAKGNRHSK